MLRAHDLLPKRELPTEEERARLEDLDDQISAEPLESRARLVQEMLDLIQNPAEDLGHRTLTAFILSAHCKSLNSVGSKVVIEKLSSTFQAESPFRTSKRGFITRKPSKDLQLAAPRFALLLALVRVMIAVDPKRGCQHLRQMAANIKDSEWQRVLRDVERSQCT